MQTVYQTSTAKANVCFVVVDLGSHSYKLDNEGYFGNEYHPFIRYDVTQHFEGDSNNFSRSHSHGCEIDLPKGHNWKLIGPLSEVSEEQAAQIVDFKNISSSCPCEYCGYDIDCYRDYQEQTKEDWEKYPVADSLRNAYDSFISLFRSLHIPEGQNIVVLAEFNS